MNLLRRLKKRFGKKGAVIRVNLNLRAPPALMMNRAAGNFRRETQKTANRVPGNSMIMNQAEENPVLVKINLSLAAEQEKMQILPEEHLTGKDQAGE